MKNMDVETGLTEGLANLVPAEKVTGVRLGEGFIVIYFDTLQKTDGANRAGLPPLPWSAGYGPVGQIVDTVV